MSAVSLSSHVLDLDSGRPGAGIAVRLERIRDAAILARAETDADGRIGHWPGIDALAPGDYRLVFAVGPYFEAHGTDTFYDEVLIAFRAREDGAHYHVPLLLSPFGYSTYRGS